MSGQSSAEMSSGRTEDDRITKATAEIRCLVPSNSSSSSSPAPSTDVLFWVEAAPRSNYGAKCPLCDEFIKPLGYRISVVHAFNTIQKPAANPFHIHCFEKVADFSQPEYLSRINPATANSRYETHAGRKFFLDAGAEQLVKQWKFTLATWMDEKSDKETQDPKSHVRTGSSDSQKLNKNLAKALDPIERDGPDDTGEWNLFEEYLRVMDDDGSQNTRQSLSRSLYAWKHDLDAVCCPSAEEQIVREKLSEKAKKGMARLGRVPRLI